MRVWGRCMCATGIARTRKRYAEHLLMEKVYRLWKISSGDGNNRNVYCIHGRQLRDGQPLMPRYTAFINFTHITTNFFSNFTMYISLYLVLHTFAQGLFIKCVCVCVCVYVRARVLYMHIYKKLILNVLHIQK